MASNQAEACSKAIDAYEEAKRNGVKGTDLATLAAAKNAALAKYKSETGHTYTGGLFS